MNEDVYLKTFVRKIIEYNQKINHFKNVTAINRPEIIDKQLKIDREQIVAQLDMSDLIEKEDSKQYRFKTNKIDFNLTLKDLNQDNKINILCIGG
jgi:hypothetical protein